MPGLIAQYGLVVVALIIFTGEIGLPTLVPGEIALLLAGSQLVHSSTALVAAALLFGTVDLVATSTIHVAARTGGNRLLRRALRMLQRNEEQHEEIIASWRCRLGGHDPLVVFVTRLIPVFRFYASITTGLIRIRFEDFLSGAAPAALLWAATPLALGYALRGEITGIEGEYGVMIRLCIVGTLVMTVLTGAAWCLRRVSSRELRRMRALAGLAVVAGISLRVLQATLVTGARHAGALNLSVPTLAAWASVMCALALTAGWIALQDLRIARGRRATSGRIGTLGTVTWVGLLLVIAGFATLVGVDHAAAQALVHR